MPSQPAAPFPMTLRETLADRALKGALALACAGLSYGLFRIDARLIGYAASSQAGLFSLPSFEIMLATWGVLTMGLGAIVAAIHVRPPTRIDNDDSARALRLALEYPDLENYRIAVAGLGRRFNSDDFSTFIRYEREILCAAASGLEAAAKERSRAAALALESREPLPDSPLGKASASIESAACANIASRHEIVSIARQHATGADPMV